MFYFVQYFPRTTIYFYVLLSPNLFYALALYLFSFPTSANGPTFYLQIDLGIFYGPRNGFGIFLVDVGGLKSRKVFAHDVVDADVEIGSVIVMQGCGWRIFVLVWVIMCNQPFYGRLVLSCIIFYCHRYQFTR